MLSGTLWTSEKFIAVKRNLYFIFIKNNSLRPGILLLIGGKYSAYLLLINNHNQHIDGLMQKRRNSIALAMELCLFYFNILLA